MTRDVNAASSSVAFTAAAALCSTKDHKTVGQYFKGQEFLHLHMSALSKLYLLRDFNHIVFAKKRYPSCHINMENTGEGKEGLR